MSALHEMSLPWHKTSQAHSFYVLLILALIASVLYPAVQQRQERLLSEDCNKQAGSSKPALKICQDKHPSKK